MTKEEAFDSIVDKLNGWNVDSQTADGPTWDDLDDQFKQDLFELAEAAGGNPEGKGRRR